MIDFYGIDEDKLPKIKEPEAEVKDGRVRKKRKVWLSNRDILLYCKSLENPPQHIKDYMPYLEKRAKEDQEEIDEQAKMAKDSKEQPIVLCGDDIDFDEFEFVPGE